MVTEAQVLRSELALDARHLRNRLRRAMHDGTCSEADKEVLFRAWEMVCVTHDLLDGRIAPAAVQRPSRGT